MTWTGRTGARFAALLAILLAPCAAWTADAPVIADTYISAATPNVNFGALPALSLTGDTSVLLRFSLAGLPAGVHGSDIPKAVLYVYVSWIGTQGSMDLGVVNGPWTESAVTAGSAPPIAPAGLPAVPITQANQWVAVDITTVVQRWADAPGSNYGIALRAVAAPAMAASFDSKENASTGHAPKIDVVVGDPNLRAALCNLYLLTGKAAPGNLGCPASSCTNGIKDGNETDVDCGGSCPSKCATGRSCAANPDCLSGNCAGGVCAAAACSAPNALCGGLCVNLNASVGNCGACGTVCGGANGTAQCINGRCSMACLAGWGDCDMNAANGCETNIRTNPNNCGACGQKCAAGQACVNGVCR